jgi:Flp pilus assembly protein TadB
MSITGALSRAEEDSPLLAAIGGHLQAFASYGCGALLAATLVWHLPKALIWVPGAAVLFALGASAFPGKLQRRRR